MKKKIHFSDLEKPWAGNEACCGEKGKAVLFAFDLDDVTCERCKKTKAYLDAKQKEEQKRPLEESEFKEPEKEISEQLKKDAKKYSLRKEHIDIMRKIDYEIVNAHNECEGCVFEGVDTPPCTNFTGGFINCGNENMDYSIIFKQVHKTQESLNKAIEKESLKEDVKEPFNVTEIMKNRVDRIDKKPSKYHKRYYSMLESKSITLDVYDLLDTLNLPNPEIEHTFKKLVRSGSGDKDLLTDLKEAKVQLEMGIKRIERMLNK